MTVEYSFTPAKSDKQFKRAQELNARHTVRVERGVMGATVIKVKDLKTREEKAVPREQAVAAIRS